jgi:hypothetical protein
MNYRQLSRRLLEQAWGHCPCFALEGIPRPFAAGVDPSLKTESPVMHHIAEAPSRSRSARVATIGKRLDGDLAAPRAFLTCAAC